MKKLGSCSIYSATDSKWNFHFDNINVCAYEIPEIVKIKIENLKLKYGEPPKDLEYFFCKY